MNRRQLLHQSLALAGTAALGGMGRAAGLPTLDRPWPSRIRIRHSAARLSRIAFGSCAEAGKPQPVWDPILARKPDLFMFLGDNIYADTRDMAVMKRKYAELAAQPGFSAPARDDARRRDVGRPRLRRERRRRRLSAEGRLAPGLPRFLGRAGRLAATRPRRRLCLVRVRPGRAARAGDPAGPALQPDGDAADGIEWRELRRLGREARRLGPTAPAGTVRAQPGSARRRCSASANGNGSSASSRCRRSFACSARACRSSRTSPAGRPGPTSRATRIACST